MIVFASLVLYKCRAYLVCAFRPGVVAELEGDEVAMLRVAWWVFLGWSASVLLMRAGDGGEPFHALGPGW